MPEKWVDVKGFEGRYRVSDWGRIKSLKRTRRNNGGVWSILEERILKPGKLPRGYLTIGLTKESGKSGYERRGWYVHRLVWESFKGPIPDGLEINHKDGVKANNRLSNLEVGTHKENIHHAIRNGLTTIHKKGSGNPGAVLTEDKVRRIKIRLRKGDVQRRISEDFGVCPQTITLIKQEKIWTHVR